MSTCREQLARRVARVQRDVEPLLGARNLKVWTKYKGADPEENYSTTDVQSELRQLRTAPLLHVRLNLHY